VETVASSTPAPSAVESGSIYVDVTGVPQGYIISPVLISICGLSTDYLEAGYPNPNEPGTLIMCKVPVSATPQSALVNPVLFRGVLYGSYAIKVTGDAGTPLVAERDVYVDSPGQINITISI
jgi:hypothetical protein